MLEKDPTTIRQMFAAIAPRYDRANRVLSMRFDVAWRRKVARRLLDSPGVVLDLASGTGDLALALASRSHRVIAADFTFEMLVAGREKFARSSRVAPVTADALRIPSRDGSFEAVTVAFGIRNFADPSAGLAEMFRVLKPRGVCGVLEFSRPGALLNALYAFYFRRILPLIGGLLTGRREAYEYLPASVGEFPQGEAFLDLMRRAGFTELTATRLSGGIATFYRGVKL